MALWSTFGPRATIRFRVLSSVFLIVSMLYLPNVSQRIKPQMDTSKTSATQYTRRTVESGISMLGMGIT
jgi:hypothetical protein